MQDTVQHWMMSGVDLTLPSADIVCLSKADGTEKRSCKSSEGALANETANVTVGTDSEGARGAHEARGLAKRCWRRLAKLVKRTVGSTAIMDSGATGNFGRAEDGMVPTGEPSGKVVGCPNGGLLVAKEKALLPMTTLRMGAREGDIIPGLANTTLCSVPKLASNGYTSIFYANEAGMEVYDQRDVEIKATAKPVLRGWRDAGGLWRVPMTAHPTDEWWQEDGLRGAKITAHQANNLYSLPSILQRIAYLHACLGFPTKAAMLDAAGAGRLTGIPFATVKNIREHYPETVETPKGHLDQQRHGV